MKNITTPLTSIFFTALFLLEMVHAQPGSKLCPAEIKLAEILLRDTTSKTVSYLPKGYWFGLEDRSHGYLKLVKNGKKNFILRDGTHQVYLLNENNGKAFLQRLDSSVFYGDNFLSMCFLRKDTIYQYGGYGFWNTRDFFMYFRNANRDWEFLTGGRGLPNEQNYHWYDAKEDAFYMIGSLSSTHHPLPKKILVDSIYRYDFATRNWKSLGNIPQNTSELNLLWKLDLSVCFTPFGFIDTRTSVTKLYDIPRNRVLSPTGKFADFILKIGLPDPLYNPDYRLFIDLQDTLHIIQGTKEKIVYSNIHLSLNDFDQTRPQLLYIPSKTDSYNYYGLERMWLFSLAIPFSLAGYFILKRRRRKFSPESASETPYTEPDSEDAPEVIEPSRNNAPIAPPAQIKDIAFFRSQLNPTEIELLDMLLKATLAGTTADIQSINKTLGVSNKETSLQKARRSICINNINSCFRQTLKVDENLIIRERDSDDKRAFVYKLDARFVEQIKG